MTEQQGGWPEKTFKMPTMDEMFDLLEAVDLLGWSQESESWFAGSSSSCVRRR